MAVETILDDTLQTSVYIPFEEPELDDVGVYTLFPDRDLPNGYELRLAAYKTAWSKCLQRVQESIHTLHAPIVDGTVELVNKAYTDILLGLPYVELPVISVTVFGASSSIFDEISARLETEGQDDLFDDVTGTHIVTHLFPQDCPNIVSAMKMLVMSFISKTERELESVKRKPASSLSTADINLLYIWFDELCESRGSNSDTTRLVIILHEFERFDPMIVQDLFEISSSAIPRLPLVFILSMTSPPTPSFIHATYPRSTLARLQVRSHSFSTSRNILEDILLKTFFDVEFDPDLVPGPATIEFVADFFRRHSPSLDGLVSILQLVHMKHFEEPLTIFHTKEKLMRRDFTDPESAPFLDSILTRVQSLYPEPDHSTGWLTRDIDELLVLVQTARINFQKQMKLLRVSFRLFLLVQNFVVSFGHKSEKTLSELMCAALRGRLGTSYRYLCVLVKKLQSDQLDALLSDLYDFFLGVSAQVQAEERTIISRIDMARSVNGRRETGNMAEAVCNWLLEYFEHRFVTPEELPLWDIWYTGSTPFPSELLNPSLRASIFSGLLYPQDYDADTVTDNDEDDETLWKIPDTSILFQRYLESGKMINVFDWFESFMVVLETQRERAKRDKSARQKGKQRRVEQERSPPEESEEDLEKWRTEVQARFIRSLHELDYVGLIKHTGRKVDHVMRTVFDVPD